MDKFEQECSQFLQQCKQDGLTETEIKQLCYNNLKDPEIKRFYAKEMRKQRTPKDHRFGLCCWLVIPCIVSMVTAGVVMAMNYNRDNFDDQPLSEYLKDQLKTIPCLLDQNEISLEVTRPLFNCSLCKGLATVPSETSNISQARFEELYAYSSIPVVMRGTAETWEARNVFSFDFFKSLYTAQEGALDYVQEQCQFFPYNTHFRTLKDVFNMSKEMSELKEEKWYVGWSNCEPHIERELRRHFPKPAFLPPTSVSSHLDWIFMGGWGRGASIHLDNVERPSWQAQLSGTKTWTLVPSPECETMCQTLEVKVNSGDIIVVDTNQWYHSTYIHPGQISITIGSEYD